MPLSSVQRAWPEGAAEEVGWHAAPVSSTDDTQARWNVHCGFFACSSKIGTEFGKEDKRCFFICFKLGKHLHRQPTCCSPRGCPMNPGRPEDLKGSTLPLHPTSLFVPADSSSAGNHLLASCCASGECCHSLIRGVPLESGQVVVKLTLACQTAFLGFHDPHPL